MIKLSKRLQTIADRIPQDSRVADIGSDHALLPVYLCQTGRIRFAVAGEINPGPLRAADKQVREAGLKDMISVRLGNGLQVLSPRETDTIVIAGMGGGLIAQILHEGKAKLHGIRRLILQPNIGEERVRRWLLEQGWALTDEAIIEEDGKIYEIITAERNEEAELFNKRLYAARSLGESVTVDTETLLLLGPHFLQEAAPIWRRKWQYELEKLKAVAVQVAASSTEEAARRHEELQRQIHTITEVLECLPKAKPSSN
jgi:tRNA (adenine22-N1)-methyltransferase